VNALDKIAISQLESERILYASVACASAVDHVLMSVGARVPVCARSRSGQAALKLVLNFRYVGDVNLQARNGGHLVLHERGLRSIMGGKYLFGSLIGKRYSRCFAKNERIK